MSAPASGGGSGIRAEVAAAAGRPATSEEVAALVAVVGLWDLDRRRVAADAVDAPSSMWVHATRRAGRRAGMQRGPWRMSGRLARRSRT